MCSKSAEKSEIAELMSVWSDVVTDLTSSDIYADMPVVREWVTKVLQYNVPDGKKGRALPCIYTFRSLVSSDELTEENIYHARILSWCTELLQAFVLVIDDIVDQGVIRRNRKCWHLHDDIGLAAINDGLLLESATFQLLKRHFKKKDFYIDLVELFQETCQKMEMGQCLDLLSTNFGKKPNLDLFTMDRYNSIVKYKTGYYTFLLPVKAAMYLAGIKDPEMYRQAKTILLEMGHFFQVQDDFLDCYCDPKVMGKVGTDIQEGKCSWLIVIALQRATPHQKKILKECYGDSDPEKIKLVKELYNDLDLRNAYYTYKEETHNVIKFRIQQMLSGALQDLFLKLLKDLMQ